MPRLRRVLLVAALGFLLLPGFAWAGLSLPSPSGLFASLIEKATGGAVTVTGASGLPNNLHFDRVELHDSKGVWLVAEDVTLQWHPYLVLTKTASIELLRAARVQLPRLKVSAGGSSELPVKVELKQLEVDRADVGAPVLGAAAVVSLRGSLDLPSYELPTAHLVMHDLGSGGDYQLDAHVTDQRTEAAFTGAEPQGGLLARIAGLPDIGKLRLEASVAGPQEALATKVALTAGPANAHATGTVNLTGETLDLQVDASAPAMHPAPNVSWQGVQLQAVVRGKFTAPDATGRLQIDQLAASGTTIRQLSADLGGNAGQVRLHAVAEGVRIAGPDPQLLESAPLVLDASVRLDDPARPLTFKLEHPLLAAEGQARTAGNIDATAAVRIARLAPLAAIGGLDLQGSTEFRLHASVQDGATSLDSNGTLSLTGGQAPLPGLLGTGATFALSGQMRGEEVTGRLTTAGKNVKLSLEGTRTAQKLQAALTASLTQLGVLAPTLSGALDVTAQVAGPPDDLALTAHAQGEIGAQGVPRGPVAMDVALHGLPGAPTGTVRAQGQLAGAPVQLALAAQRNPDGSYQASIERADWRSLHAEGALRLPAGATVPLGRIDLQLGQLADLRPFVGQPITGSVNATVNIDPAEARLQLEAKDAGVPGTRIGQATVNARVRDPLNAPVVTASASLTGIEAGRVSGSAKLDVTGPQNALAFATDASLRVAGNPAQIAGAGVLDAAEKKLLLSRLQVDSHGQTARLLAPATFRFGQETSVDRLRIGLRSGVLDVSGQLAPRLDAAATLRAPADIAAIVSPGLALDGTVALDAKLTGTPAQPSGTVRISATGLHQNTGPGRSVPPANVVGTAELQGGAVRVQARATAGSANLAVAGEVSPRLNLTVTARAPAEIAALYDPNLALNGSLALDARLTGTAAEPGGTVRISATGLRMRTGPGRALPPANIMATAELHGRSARIDARASAGSASFRVAGEAPLGSGPLDLRATGGMELALLDPILTAQGRRARGRLTLDAAIAGTTAAPRVSGGAQLANGEILDYTEGLRIDQIAAIVRGDGETLRIVSFTGRAGPGTISASGTVGLAAPGLPLDLHVVANDARPISSDQLQMTLDANLLVRGPARGDMLVSGRVLIRRAEIRIPSRLPPKVAVLKVIRPGDKRVLPAAPAPSVALDLVVDAPEQVFVRGRGVNAELSGTLRIRGQASSPQVAGGLEMRRGELSVAGTTLTFSRGKVSFGGTSVAGKIDPTLDFVAETTSNNVTATLTISGYASDPKVAFSSTPPLPQDEVLSYLLFRRSIKEIGPFQIASMAAAVAELTGVTGEGTFNPLGDIRSGLGLDRLTVGGSSTGTGATVEAGKYVASGVYLGAKENTAGGPGATLQIDITKGLKLETDVGAGRGGNQVGLTYQFEY